MTLLLAATCLRPAITTVGPVLDQIGASTGSGDALLGLLASMPLLAFALVSPFVAPAAARLGVDRLLLLALLALAVAIAVRSLPGGVSLWAGTLGIGAAVAIGNVLLPAVVKRDFPHRITLVTGLYSASMGAFAALASGTVVPLGDALGGWRPALAVWAVLPFLVVLLWWLRPATPPSVAGVLPSKPPTTLLRSAGAWQITVFFGLQSAAFYTLVTWLPTIEQTLGVDMHRAGLHLFVYQVLGMLSGIAISVLMQGRDDQRLPAFMVGVPVLVAALGLLMLPELALLWIAMAGLGSGSSLTLSLSLVAIRTTTAQETAALSGMAQSLGYLISAAGPLLAGIAFDWSGSRVPVLQLVAGIAVAQIVLSLWAGRTAPVRVA
jgi:CP family cyanate transporter-like MFS transporter